LPAAIAGVEPIAVNANAIAKNTANNFFIFLPPLESLYNSINYITEFSVYCKDKISIILQSYPITEFAYIW
ncbi:hypothetical protein P4236_22765, partial [Bacillus thuringiensis]|nr:hypothetical protein [Bacillus thuringiensis]